MLNSKLMQKQTKLLLT